MLTRTQTSGFTLIELLLVMLILLALAVVAHRMFGISTEDSKQAALDTNLMIMNEAIERYRLEHKLEYPGTIGGTTSWANFVTHMTTQTDMNGDPGTDHGPYLKTGIPPNPFNGSKTGALYELPLVLNVTLGWYYDADAGLIRENANAKTAGAEGSVELEGSVIPIIP